MHARLVIALLVIAALIGPAAASLGARAAPAGLLLSVDDLKIVVGGQDNSDSDKVTFSGSFTWLETPSETTPDNWDVNFVLGFVGMAPIYAVFIPMGSLTMGGGDWDLTKEGKDMTRLNSFSIARGDVAGRWDFRLSDPGLRISAFTPPADPLVAIEGSVAITLGGFPYVATALIAMEQRGSNWVSV